MKFTPHDYQVYCTDYLKTHPVAALFLEMGLGKSVIALTAINDLMLDRFQVSKVLIIAPLRVARDTWPAEIAKWDHLRFLDISVITGTVKERTRALNKSSLIDDVRHDQIRD